ncbi:MAG TPA: tetratricopeptide repeat protein [Candidatus Angelobacter sp.]
MSGSALAQTTKAQLEVSETIFSVAAALNACGYDAGMDNADPIRLAVRTDVIGATRRSPDAAQALRAICVFQQDHLPPDPSMDLAQYVSLALDLGEPPDFAPTQREADLPPDASRVLGLVPLLQKFYRRADLHAIWQKHQAEYNALVQRFHDPISNIILQSDLYLRLQFSGYVGRRFVIYLEPLLAPTQVNSRNYADNYFLVVSPGQDGSVHVQDIRHTYLHYVLEPLALKHGRTLERLDPLLGSVQTAPMADPFKHDISLLLTECLIRAIEARMLPGGKTNEGARTASVQRSMEEGFILTRYFYGAMVNFEKESTGMTNFYGDLLYNISLDQEKKRASEIVFSSQAAPEVLSASKPSSHEIHLLDDAEDRLSRGDPAGAQRLALQAVQDPKSNEDQGRAFFILARAATLSGDMEGARTYFERSVQAAHDPRTLAWSHIYLGRIFDIQENRDQAVAHYRAALQAGDPTPDTKTAAEKGLAVPYHPPSQQPTGPH